MFVRSPSASPAASNGAVAGAAGSVVRAAALRYVTDGSAGMSRRRIGKRFAYFDTDGRRVRDPDVIARVNSLAIPPAQQ